MPEIKFSNEKAERWLDRVGKRLEGLSAEDRQRYAALRAILERGDRLDSQQAKALHLLGKKV